MAMQSPLAPHSHLLSRPGLALVIMLASACTTVDRERAPEATIVPIDLETWEARGKAAVTVGSETETVRFVWQRTNDETETITLSGPLSMNRQIIERRGTALYQADGSALRPLVTTSESSALSLSLIHISEPTRRRGISYAVFCLKKKKIRARKRRSPIL